MTGIRNLRWWIVALISLGTILNYVARNSLGVLAPVLKDTLGLTTQDYSYVVGAFQLAYTVMQPVCGFVVDRIGLQLGFALFAAAWSFANMAHGLASGWLGLAFFRGLLGMSEAVAIPAGMKAIAEWFPARERSVATGWFNAGTSFGALLAPPLVIAVSLAASWRVAFLVTGALGLVWAAGWYAFYRPPARHPAITPDERRLIADGHAASPAVERAGALAIVALPRFWAIATPRFLAEPAWQTFSFWIPFFLATRRGMDLRHIALFAWLPFLAADCGGVLGGYVSPFLMRRFGLALVPSRIVGVALAAVLMIAPGCVGPDTGPGVRTDGGDRAVLRRRVRPPDDFRADQHVERRRVRASGSRPRQRLRRPGRLARRPAVLAADRASQRHDRLPRRVRPRRRGGADQAAPSSRAVRARAMRRAISSVE